MTSRPKIHLSQLRDIGWTSWDPIGLSHIEGDWRESRAADEYDSYLMRAAGMVRQGVPLAEAAAYLVQIESEYMGLGNRAGAYSRALATVTAMKSDPDLWRENED
jgi:hypothetical protein